MSKRRSPKQWQTLFAKYQTSGLTQAEFCQQHGVNAKYFSLRWRRFIDGKQPPSDFIRVQPPQHPASGEVSLHYQEVAIRFTQVEARFIADVARALL